MRILLSVSVLLVVLVGCSAPRPIDKYELEPTSGLDGLPERFQGKTPEGKCDVLIAVCNRFSDRSVSFDLSIDDGHTVHPLWTGASLKPGIEFPDEDHPVPREAARGMFLRVDPGTYKIKLTHETRSVTYELTAKHADVWIVAAVAADGVAIEPAPLE